MKEMYKIEAMVSDPVKQALLTNVIVNDRVVYQIFSTIEEAHGALDDFCERKDLPMSCFNVQTVKG